MFILSLLLSIYFNFRVIGNLQLWFYCLFISDILLSKVKDLRPILSGRFVVYVPKFVVYVTKTSVVFQSLCFTCQRSVSCCCGWLYLFYHSSLCVVNFNVRFNFHGFYLDIWYLILRSDFFFFNYVINFYVIYVIKGQD